MDLTCFVFEGWEPRIRAASLKREWMDSAPESFPYRCLPLDIANCHGWEILNPCGFEVEWNGGMAAGDVTVRVDPGAKPDEMPVALFGQGTFTFHVQGLFRTAPGWNLWVSGPPNLFKDGAAPLSGIIETDWSPYSFTMNWRLTRPGHTVRFEENEPFAQIFPIERKIIEEVEPSFALIDEDPVFKSQFKEWSRSRDAFHERMRTDPPSRPSDKWQKLYYRGQNPDGQCPVADHRSKLRVREFARSELTGSAPAAMLKAAPAPEPQPIVPSKADSRTNWEAAKLAWILDIQERQRALSPATGGIARREGLSEADFLDQYYAPGRPVVLANVAADWPARSLWSMQYLRDKIGTRIVEYQGERTGDVDFELNKDAHKRRSTFAEFIDLIARGKDNDFYITAYNSGENAAALECLNEDLGSVDYLRHEPGRMDAMLWIGPKNTFTPLHHDLTNNLLVQLVGRKRLLLAAPSETPRLYNDRHVFSRVSDAFDPNLDFARFPLLRDVRFYELILEPGDALFIPIGWWHQVAALDFSVTGTYTNFKWPNEGWDSHPREG